LRIQNSREKTADCYKVTYGEITYGEIISGDTEENTLNIFGFILAINLNKNGSIKKVLATF
jgi:hypothetical protein